MCHSKLLSFRIIVIPNYFHSELLSFQTTVISNYCHFEYPNNTIYCLLVLPPLLAPALATALPKAEKIGRHICEYSLIYFSLNCTVQPYTLYNAILRIARNFLETRKNIKILTHPFYHINLG